MPLNCPRNMPEYNSCLDCRLRHENECWATIPGARKLSEILTIEERIAVLEDRKEVPEVNIVTISKNDYQQLQRLILALQEKMTSHVDKDTLEKKGRYGIDRITEQ